MERPHPISSPHSHVTSHKPKRVSVCMVTYNHEPFIAQAIEGVLMQRAGCQVELVIGEDSSLDRTRSIVEKYAVSHPAVIVPLLSERNLGIQENLRRVLQACHGEYIAFCDGDDYWTDPQKLAIQIAVMDSEPDCALCCHNVEIVQAGRSPRSYWIAPPAGRCTYGDFLRNNFIPTVSVVARSRWIPREFPDWFFTYRCTDWDIFSHALRHGYARCINRTMAAYRLHPGGVFNGMDPIERVAWKIAHHEFMWSHIHGKHQSLRACIDEQQDILVRMLLEAGRDAEAKTWWRTNMVHMMKYARHWKLGFACLFPRLARAWIRVRTKQRS